MPNLFFVCSQSLYNILCIYIYLWGIYIYIYILYMCVWLIIYIIYKYYIYIYLYNHKEFSLSDKAQIWPNRIASARHPYQLIVWDMWVLYRKKVAQLHCWLDMSSTMQHGTWEMKGTCSQTAQLCSHCAFGFSWISAALRQQNAAQSGEGWGTAGSTSWC